MLDTSYERPKSLGYLQCQLFGAKQGHMGHMVEYVNWVNSLMSQMYNNSAQEKTKEMTLTIRDNLR